MKITKIEKKKRLYLLEIDNKDELYITEDTIVQYMLTKGMTLEMAELDEIKSFAQFSYGKNLALYYLSFKQRSEKEIKDYLIKHDIETAVISKILVNLKKDKWIDDKHLAENLIQQNASSGDKGAYVLKQKLLKKGIALNTIEQVLDTYDFSEPAERAAHKLLKKYEGKLPSRALQNKISQYLLTKGFSYAEVSITLENLAIEKDEETEDELISKELEKQYHKYSRKYDGYSLKQRLTQALVRKGFDYDRIASALREYL
ncbi:recombination regulator RecX [Streptococcus dentiloxodontae]